VCARLRPSIRQVLGALKVGGGAGGVEKVSEHACSYDGRSLSACQIAARRQARASCNSAASENKTRPERQSVPCISSAGLPPADAAGQSLSRPANITLGQLPWTPAKRRRHHRHHRLTSPIWEPLLCIAARERASRPSKFVSRPLAPAKARPAAPLCPISVAHGRQTGENNKISRPA
jgi:hypothetical protein